MQSIIKKCLLLFLVSSSCFLCRGYRILVVFPMVGKSHAMLGEACVQLLLDAGHQVTYITWGLSAMQSHRNLTVIDVTIPNLLENRYNIRQSMIGKVNLNNMHQFSMIMSTIQRRILEHDTTQKLLNDPSENFDVAILEWLYGEYIVGLPAVFGCPYIWFSTMEPHSLILGLIGEVTNPSYTATNCFRSIPPFTFLERVKSLKDQLSIYLYKEFYINALEESDYERVIAPLIAKRGNEIPSYNNLRHNASLVLGNSHISVGRSIKLPLAYIEIGGYHVNITKEPLPKDLKTLMDNSNNGLIYFSLGSSLKSKDIPDDIIEELLNIFSRLEQTVLWKYEAELSNLPTNVHIVSWAPQQHVLAHPNCVLFISHGGQLSMLEAVHYGVPVIGIPVFVDQHLNVKTLASKGMAKEVEIHNMVRDLKAAIEEMLKNTSYTQAAKHQSFIYHDRPISPAAEMVFWVEHVIRTNGAAHLRSVTFMVPWYQKYYLDLAVIVFVTLVLLIRALKRLLLWLKSGRIQKDNDKKVQ